MRARKPSPFNTAVPAGRKKKFLLLAAVLCFAGLMLFWRSLPEPLFDVAYSTVLEDRDGYLLSARIADDGQWRFPHQTPLPEQYTRALLHFEDKRFYYHPGVDPLAFGRALYQNLSAGSVVSGGSTISMQVIRMAGGNPPRTIPQKMKEMVQAVRLELRYSKAEVLQLYASHAPFGGNVVGFEAAAWRYFGRPAHELSWAESATLAVLPNSPALIHPGRNRHALENKRNNLLQSLHEAGEFDELTLDLALREPVPESPHALPQLAPHLLDRVYISGNRGKQLRTPIDSRLQQRAENVLQRHYEQLRQNEIHNAAAIILDVKTGKVLMYAGNTTGNLSAENRGHSVDIIRAPRSTGSILKPLLYTLMMDQGHILPHTLIADVPTQISGYAPQNFSRTYMGAVPASEVVSRSLNVPSVRMLQNFGLPQFHHYLKEMGMSTINRPPEHYGLTLVLGGAEGSLWDITGVYASLARHLVSYDARRGENSRFVSQSPVYFVEGDAQGDVIRAQNTDGLFGLSAGAVWAMMEAMSEVTRPEGEVDFRRFDSARKVAWKTGTSFGHRDAWAVGMTPEYVIGVWVGNAGGEGRPELTGVRKAAPIMFDLFNLLGETSWFSEPVYSTERIEICRLSGHRAGPECEHTDVLGVARNGLETSICPYHRRIHVDAASGDYRVNSRCASPSEIRAESRFVLPPSMAWYYRDRNAGYRNLPDWMPGCEPDEAAIAGMELIYPVNRAEIYVPLELDGSRGMSVFEAAHQKPGMRIFWHLNGEYAGSTTGVHQLAVAPEAGWYTITLVDENGERLEQQVRFLNR